MVTSSSTNDGRQPPARTLARPGPGGRLAWALWALAIAFLAAAAWLDHLLGQADRPDLRFAPDAALPVLMHLSAASVGAVVAARRPTHPVGWLLLAIGAGLNASMAATAYAHYGLDARPAALPAADWAARLLPAATVAALTGVGFILLLTPTGSLPSPSRWWRWWARGMAAAPAGLLLAAVLAPTGWGQPTQAAQTPFDLHAFGGVVLGVNQAAFAVAVAGIVVGAGSLLARFGRARGTERQQLRWVAFAAAGMAVLAVLAGVAVALGVPGLPDPALTGTVSAALLPVALGAAILRYRLYDLDRIVSRTLAYGLLTLLLGGGYALVVVGLGQLFAQDSPLVVAAATLAVAAAFQPARRRIQAVVDRHFNRRRYDAARTIEAFSTRLRQQLDVDRLAAELLVVVDQTMQPTRASLWLRPVTTQPGAGAPALPPTQHETSVADDKATPVTGGIHTQTRSGAT